MQPTRRDFLRLGLGSSTLLATGTLVPTFLANSAVTLAGQPAHQNGERILVVLQLDGGNDGLNTVVPFDDDVYRRSRPRLGLPAGRLHRLNDRVGLHPNLQELMRVHDNRQLAIVQSVGYPNPNRSHFQSMAIWHTAQLQPDRATPGWLARCLDQRFNGAGGDSPAFHISESLLPQALQGSQRHVPSLASLEQFQRRLGIPAGAEATAQQSALDRIGQRQIGEEGSLQQFVQRTSVITYASSARLGQVMQNGGQDAGYPAFYPLAQRLKLIAQMIKAGMQTRIYYTELGGFDTHADQLGAHANLLQQVGNALKAFLDDLNRAGEGSRVLVLVFSEFGRRLRENASGGTDHGTAGPVFLLGPSVRAGLHGPYPNLGDLEDGDPRYAIDFRRVYATILDQWLGCPSQNILGARLDSIPILRGQESE
jgi:uncharacterized protein (DUF1501 family)